MRVHRSFRYVRLAICIALSNIPDHPGHFYAPIGPDAAQLKLLLDALPAKLPLVECSSACLCVSNCQNRLTQTSVRYVHVTVITLPLS